MNFLSDTLLSQENGEMGKCRQVVETLYALIAWMKIHSNFTLMLNAPFIVFRFITFSTAHFFPSIRLISLKLLFEYTVHCTLCMTGAAMMWQFLFRRCISHYNPPSSSCCNWAINSFLCSFTIFFMLCSERCVER